MNSGGENFDQPCHEYRVIHIYNRSDVYHITRQILQDCSFTQDSCCFFYHLLTKDTEDFNICYGSFAYLTLQSSDEAAVYLNVNCCALEHIVYYLQTGKIDMELVEVDEKRFREILDLAIMFGMPRLVNQLRHHLLYNKQIVLQNFQNHLISLYQNETNDQKLSHAIEKTSQFVKKHDHDIIQMLSGVTLQFH